jgi:hypothetical protein
LPDLDASLPTTAGASTRRPLTRPPVEYTKSDDSTAIAGNASAADPVVTEGLGEQPSSRGASTHSQNHTETPTPGRASAGEDEARRIPRRGGNAGPRHLSASPAEGHTVIATADGNSASPSLTGGSVPPVTRTAPTPAAGEGKFSYRSQTNRPAATTSQCSPTKAEERDAGTVTDAGVRRCGDGSRNAILETELARVVKRAEQGWHPDHPLYALLGVTSADQAGANAASAFIARTSYGCTRCGRPFGDGDVVYRRKAYPDMVMRSWCRECVYPPSLDKAAKPRLCEGGCGVFVSGWYGAFWPVAPRVCSARCSRLARNARRRGATIATCGTCGYEFQQRRSDARYCSNACRQDAYRRRKRGDAL